MDQRDSMRYDGFVGVCDYLLNSEDQCVINFRDSMLDFFSNITINGKNIGTMSQKNAIKHIIAGIIYGRVPNIRGGLNGRCQKVENNGATKDFFDRLTEYTDLLFDKARASLKKQTEVSKALELEGKTVIASDIHCDYKEMMRIIEKSDGVDHIIFSGDTFGHSYENAEDTYITIFMVLLHQISNPKVKFLRGNHEVTFLVYDSDTGVTESYRLKRQLQSIFNRMPICAMVKSSAPQMPEVVAQETVQAGLTIFVSHAGIPRKALTFEELRVLPIMKQETITSFEILEASTQKSGQVVFDMLYSEPQERESHPDRSSHLSFARVFRNSHIDTLSGTQYSEFARQCGITHFIRGHSHPSIGIAQNSEKVITVASSGKIKPYYVDGTYDRVQPKVIVIDGGVLKCARTDVSGLYSQSGTVMLASSPRDSHQGEAHQAGSTTNPEGVIGQSIENREHNAMLYNKAVANATRAYLECVSFLADKILNDDSISSSLSKAKCEELVISAFYLLRIEERTLIKGLKYFDKYFHDIVSECVYSALKRGVPLASLASTERMHSIINLLKERLDAALRSGTNLLNAYDLVKSDFNHALLLPDADLAEYSYADTLDSSAVFLDTSIRSRQLLLSICKFIKTGPYDFSRLNECFTEDGFLVQMSDLSPEDNSSVLDDGSFYTGSLPWTDPRYSVMAHRITPGKSSELEAALQSETAEPYGKSVAMYQKFMDGVSRKYHIEEFEKHGALNPNSYAYDMYFFIICVSTSESAVTSRYGFILSNTQNAYNQIREWNFTECEITSAREFVLNNISLSKSDFLKKLKNDDSGAFSPGSSFGQRKYLADAAFSRLMAEFPVYTIGKPSVLIHTTDKAAALLGVDEISRVKPGYEFTPSVFLCASSGVLSKVEGLYKIRILLPTKAGLIPASSDLYGSQEIRFPIHTRFKVTSVDFSSFVITVEPCSLPIAEVGTTVIDKLLDTQDGFHALPSTKRAHGSNIKITEGLSLAYKVIADILTDTNGIAGSKCSEIMDKIEKILCDHGIAPAALDLRLIRSALSQSNTMRFVLDLPQNLKICCSRSLNVASILSAQSIIIHDIQSEINAINSLINIFKKRVLEIQAVIEIQDSRIQDLRLSPLQIEQRQEILRSLADRIKEFNSDLLILTEYKDLFMSSDFTDMLTRYNALVSEGGNFEKIYAYQIFMSSQEVMNDEKLSLDERKQALLRYNALKCVLIKNSIIDTDCRLTQGNGHLSSFITEVDHFTVREGDLLKSAEDNINRVENNSLEVETLLALDLDQFCHKLKSYWSKSHDEMNVNEKIGMMEQLILPIQKSLIAQAERLLHMDTDKDDISKAIRKYLISHLDFLKQYIKLVDGDIEKRQNAQNAQKEISQVFAKLIDSRYCDGLSARSKEEFLRDAKEFVFGTCMLPSEALSEDDRRLSKILLDKINDQLTFVLSDRSQKHNLYSTFKGESATFTVDGEKLTFHTIGDALNRSSRRFNPHQARKALRALELECIEKGRSLEPWEFRAIVLKSLGNDGYKQRGMVREFMDRAEKCGLIPKMPKSSLTASAIYDILRARGRLHPIGLSPERAQKTLEWIGNHLKDERYIIEKNLIEYVRSIGSTRREGARIFAELIAADASICKRDEIPIGPSAQTPAQLFVESPIAARGEVHGAAESPVPAVFTDPLATQGDALVAGGIVDQQPATTDAMGDKMPLPTGSTIAIGAH